MIAGEIVQLPRTQVYRCVGCHRLTAIGSVVTLDLPDGESWAIVCYRCYRAEIVGAFFGLGLIWNGEKWLEKAESGGDGGFGGEGPPPKVSIAS